MWNTERAWIATALCVALIGSATTAFAQTTGQPTVRPTLQTPTVTPTQPQPSVGGPITNLRLGTAVTAAGVLSGQGTSFIAANTPTVWAVFDFAGLQPGSELVVWWSDPGTRSSIPWRVTLPVASGRVAASLTAPATGWAPGSYEVTVTPAEGTPALAKAQFTLQ